MNKNSVEKFFEQWEREHGLKVSEYPITFAKDYAEYYHKNKLATLETCKGSKYYDQIGGVDRCPDCELVL